MRYECGDIWDMVQIIIGVPLNIARIESDHTQYLKMKKKNFQKREWDTYSFMTMLNFPVKEVVCL